MMSKLLEKLERISEGSSQPLGFGAAVSRTKVSQMLVIASIPAGNAKLTAVAEKGGADALLVTVEHLDKEIKNLAKIGRAKADIPWGISSETVSKEEMEKLIEIGCDFVIFAPAKTPAAVLTEEIIGKVLTIDTSLTESLAKAVNRLQLDAVLIAPSSEEEPPFTVLQLMVYERLASVTGKHLLATMAPSMSTSDLESLWGLGVRGIVVDMAVEQPEQRLSEVKEAIQKLPTTRKKSKEKIRATLTLPRASSEKVEPEEEEEE
jgi:hypothetical protein